MDTIVTLVFVFVYKIPYRRAPRLAFRPSASREQRYLAYNICMQDTFARATHAARDDRVSCIQPLYTIYLIVARALGLAAAIRPSARANKGILHTTPKRV